MSLLKTFSFLLKTDSTKSIESSLKQKDIIDKLNDMYQLETEKMAYDQLIENLTAPDDQDDLVISFDMSFDIPYEELADEYYKTGYF